MDKCKINIPVWREVYLALIDFLDVFFFPSTGKDLYQGFMKSFLCESNISFDEHAVCQHMCNSAEVHQTQQVWALLTDFSECYYLVKCMMQSFCSIMSYTSVSNYSKPHLMHLPKSLYVNEYHSPSCLFSFSKADS